MKKIGIRITKIFAIMGIFIFGIYNKVRANEFIPCQYGVIEPEKFEEKNLFANPLFKIGFIPVIILIGLIIYIGQSYSEKKQKRKLILVLTIATAIVAIAYIKIIEMLSNT